jgi:hypothetical protein
MALTLAMRALLILPFLIVPLAACKKQPLQLEPEPVGPNMSGRTPHQMANCPAAVPGALTKVQPTADGIDVTITAPDPDAQRRIVALASFHEHTPMPLARVPHSGMRGGGARIGFCPIVHHGATIHATVVPGGVRIHLRADSPREISALRETVTERATRLPGFASS